MLVAACGGSDAPTGGGSGTAGTYTLSAVNGQALPATILSNQGGTFAIVSGTMTIGGDATFVERATIRTTSGAQVTTNQVQTNGTYSASGTVLSLRYTDGSTATATLSAGVLTRVKGDASYAYRR
jgi:hypothetical protein